jgi:hypothetical protein
MEAESPPSLEGDLCSGMPSIGHRFEPQRSCQGRDVHLEIEEVVPPGPALNRTHSR